MLRYIQYILGRRGGLGGVVETCTRQAVLVPVGAPPLVCLLPAPRPAVTRHRLALVLAAPALLLASKLVVLAVELAFLLSGHISSGQFLGLDNLHNLACIPVGLLSIYCYNILLVLVGKTSQGSNTEMGLGLVLLVLFVLFDCLRLFFVFLTGKIGSANMFVFNAKCRDRDADLCAAPLPPHGCPLPEKHHQGLPGYLHRYSVPWPVSGGGGGAGRGWAGSMAGQ